MTEPDSLLAAAVLMHGTTSLEPEELGLYWELYGVSAETPVEFSLEARKADGGGLISSLRRLLPGGGARPSRCGGSRSVLLDELRGPQSGEVHLLGLLAVGPQPLEVALLPGGDPVGVAGGLQ